MSEHAKLEYYGGQGLGAQLVARYFRHLGDVSRVLDLGCGTGDLGRYRPRPGIEVFGLDLDAGAVAQAARHETAQVCDLEAARFPFESSFFDGVVAKDVIEHVQRPWELVQEIRRVLRPGGRLVVSVPMPRPDVVWNDYTHVRGFTERAIRGLLRDFGFSVRGVARMGEVPLSGRLGLLDWTPGFLRLPGMCRLFGRSYEVVAVREEAAAR